MKQESKCLSCEHEFTFDTNQSVGKYCSNKCQQDYEKKQIIEEWKNGEYSGIVGHDGLSDTIRDYVLVKYNLKCSKCSWGFVNPYTKKLPLHVHHVDGNALNNKEENLEVLCPNCHSLTDNFGRRNTRSTRNKKKVIYASGTRVAE